MTRDANVDELARISCRQVFLFPLFKSAVFESQCGLKKALLSATVVGTFDSPNQEGEFMSRSKVMRDTNGRVEQQD